MDFSGPGSCKCTSVFSGSRYGKSGGSHDHLFVSWPGERELAAVDVLAVVDVDHVNDLLVPDHHVDEAVVAAPDPHDACRAFQRLASWRLGVGAERVECLGDPAPHYRVELREMLARARLKLDLVCGRHSPRSALTCSHWTGFAPDSWSSCVAMITALSAVSSASSIASSMTARTAIRVASSSPATFRHIWAHASTIASCAALA